jgi:hypothetical protein
MRNRFTDRGRRYQLVEILADGCNVLARIRGLLHLLELRELG